MEKVLIILRGLPGSGKSTVAQMFNTKAICCADDYLMHDGKYLWAGDKLHAAHMWCQRKCKRFMQINVQVIVVANTSVRERDLTPYYELAKQYGYDVFSIVIENRHGGKSAHDVSDESMEKYKRRFDIKL